MNTRKVNSIYCVILFMCYMNSVHCIYLVLLAIGLNKLFLIPDSLFNKGSLEYQDRAR